ncbi:DNA translocase FtsK [Lentilactobacillus sp. SPB1-3]|uniref:DNA translocase FtsK n=1 Tax=Lentilactobacillus terminaliae TaxID=3003483 RepID=A0ACD5DGT2_9LACO|nr:DNA translocase FtsK [Lentilactobacillus sp. SPB1-3]MCZ0977075.1 DNA translocase FtsK [Lentilactobacillus sp. SPB1-3]
MNHYDGPAFFRRKREKRQEVTNKKLNTESDDRQSKIKKVSHPEESTKTSKREQTSQQVLASARSFYDLPSEKSIRRTPGNNQRTAVPGSRRRGLYDLFKTELAVQPDQLILFSPVGNEYDFDLDNATVNAQSGQVVVEEEPVVRESDSDNAPLPNDQWLDNSNSATEVSSQDDQDVEDEEVADSSANEEFNEPDSEPDIYDQTDNQLDSIDDTDTAESMNDYQESNFETSMTTVEDPSKMDEDDSSVEESLTQPSLRAAKKVKVRKGLGKSFKAMLHQRSNKLNDTDRHSKETGSYDNRVDTFNEPENDQVDLQSSVAFTSHNEASEVSDARADQENSVDDAPVEFNEHWRPSITLLDKEPTDNIQLNDSFVTEQITKLNQTLSAFKVNAEVVNYTVGPTITQFEIKLALGVKVSRITNLVDDLKLALAAKDIRIEAPIPGKSTVGIEVPNPHSRPVNLAEIIDSPEFVNEQASLVAAIGEDISGTPVVGDISKMPHALIAGATGSGKSVFINGLLTSLMYKASPADLKLLLIDPKAVELSMYSGIPHLLAPVISDPQTATQALKWVTKEMDERYEKLAAASVQNIKQFNQKAEDSGEYGLKMPYILIVIDELADLMMVSSQDTEMYIARITQKARAAGIHLIVATQRPSVDVVTGTIKNNIPTRIAFAVSSQIDSRTILDTSGAEKLLGKGDMLYLQSGSSKPVRLQGAFVKNDEIHRVIDYVRQTGKPHYQFSPEALKKSYEEAEQSDPIMGDVLNYIAEEDSISTSKLQRVFSIGYNRAATIIDDLEEQHYISEQHGSKPREIYYRKNSEQE